MDYIKARIKQKIMKYIWTAVSPLLMYIIVIACIIGGASILGTLLSSTINSTNVDSGWINDIDSDIIQEANISKRQLKILYQSELDSYFSQTRNLDVQQQVDVFKLSLDENGNVIRDHLNFPVYEYDYTKYEVRNYIYDESDNTYEYRLPWQMIYAISLLSTFNGEELVEDVLEDDNSNFIISNHMLRKVNRLFSTKYELVYDFYNNTKNYYEQSTLEKLPHTGDEGVYMPSTVFTKVETCLYDYNYSYESQGSDKYSYKLSNIESVPRLDRFEELLKSVGCDINAIELIIDILIELGGCQDYVDILTGLYGIEKTHKVPDVTIDYGNVELNDITNYALQFVGNRYVYGGTSLTNGIDCSAYVQAIYRKFNVNLPRTSREQARVGVTIPSLSQAKPGDLIFYATNGVVHHVAMYLGGNKIVHASNSKPYPQGGIKITNNAQYNRIYAIKRVY